MLVTLSVLNWHLMHWKPGTADWLGLVWLGREEREDAARFDILRAAGVLEPERTAGLLDLMKIEISLLIFTCILPMFSLFKYKLLRLTRSWII